MRVSLRHVSWPSRIDIEAARQRRAAVRKAGGVLDLVLPLRVGGDGPPLFCVHPVIGLSWCYTALLQHVTTGNPVYGLQARGLRRPEPLPASMAALARDYADLVRTTQPDGPYHLLGWSLGGIVAFAVAEELERRGHRVALLALLDAYPPDPDVRDADEPWIQFNIVLADFGYPQILTRGDDHLEERVLEVVRTRPKGALYDWSEDQIRTLMRVTRNNVALATDYQPGSLGRDVLLFRAALTPATAWRTPGRWRPYAAAVEIVELDSKHEHMMQPATLAQVGAVLTRRLAAAQGDPVAGTPPAATRDGATPSAAR